MDLNDLSTPLRTRTAAAISTHQNKQAFCSMNSTTYSQLPSERFGALRQYNVQVWQEALKCPETVLETAGDRISLRQLRYCAYYATDTAYEIRHKLSAKRRAVILAHTIEMAGLAFDDDEVKIFLVEIVESMIFHPSVWKVIFGQDWTGLRLSIQAFLGIDLGLSGGNELIGEPVRPEEPKRVTTPRVRP